MKRKDIITLNQVILLSAGFLSSCNQDVSFASQYSLHYNKKKISSSIFQQVRRGSLFHICVGIYSCSRVREISVKEIANNRGGYQKPTGQLLLNLSPISHSDLLTQNNCDPFHHSNYQQRVEHFTSILSSCVPLGITQTLRILNNSPG